MSKAMAVGSIGHADYYSGWESIELLCPDCGWSGTGSTASREYFDELFEMLCRECDHKFGLVTIVVTDEQIRAAAAAGHVGAQKTLQRDLDRVTDREEWV
jgi:hypothetical protein